MSRPKKDGSYINYYIDRELVEKLRDYAEEKGIPNQSGWLIKMKSPSLRKGIILLISLR